MKLNKDPQDGSVALLFSSYQSNANAARLLSIALKTVEKFAYRDVDVWVADVGSPRSSFMLTEQDFPNVNFLFSDITPRSWVNYPLYKRIVRQSLGQPAPRNGSHANAWTLDFGIKSFCDMGYKPKYIMTLQMDVMFTHPDTIAHLVDYIESGDRCFASGVLKQRSFARTHEVLHSLGCMWLGEVTRQSDFSLFPEFPLFDVGEAQVASQVDRGGTIRGLRNTQSDEALIKDLPSDLASFNVDRAVNENNELMFLHLGRGIPKAQDSYKKQNKVDVNMWERWYKENLV